MNPGVGYMISMLGGNAESVEAFKGALGKTIAALALVDSGEPEYLRATFTDGTAIDFYDDGQSCCESRYFRTDDKLEDFIGATLDNAEISDGGTTSEDYDEHEIEFLRISTSKGLLTLSAHNEHNGYYGGISLRVRSVS